MKRATNIAQRPGAMKPRDRRLALRAHRLGKRGKVAGEIATKLRLPNSAAVQLILFKGNLIAECEARRLTDRELEVMTVLARVEARRVALGEEAPKTNQVDFAAGKRSGWCSATADKRLRMLRLFEEHKKGHANPRDRLNLVFQSDQGRIWLTPAGWAFVWAAGMILPNWKVPA